LKRAEPWIDRGRGGADPVAVAAVADAAQVRVHTDEVMGTAAGDSTVDVVGCAGGVGGHDGVVQSARAAGEDAGTVIPSRVAADVAAAHGQHADVADAAAFVGSPVVAESAAVHSCRAAVRDTAAGPVRATDAPGRVAADRAAVHGQRAPVEDAAAGAIRGGGPAGHVATEGAAVHGQRTEVADAAAGEGRRVAAEAGV